MTDRTATFATHDIVERVETPTFCSYLLQGRRDGRRVGTYWCRVSAFARHVSVVGDFDPIVFAYGPASPRDLIAWVGRHPELDSYIIGKAAIGSGGRDRISCWDADDAVAGLREHIAELQREAAEHREDGGETWYAERSAEIGRLLDITDEHSTHDGRLGCELIGLAVYEALSDPSDCHWIEDLGRKVGVDVHLAHAAVVRLHALLSAEEAGPESAT